MCHLTHACAGYCSLAHFSEGELGTPLPADRIPAHIRPFMESAAKSVAPTTPGRRSSAEASRRAATPAEAPLPEQPAANGAQVGSAAKERKRDAPAAMARAASMPELAAAHATGRPAEP